MEATGAAGGAKAAGQGGSPRVAARMSMMTELMTAATKTIQGAGTATMAQLLADLAKSRLAAVPDPALKTSDGDDTRGILVQRDADSMIAITQLRKALVSTVGDGVNFAKGCEELVNDVVRNLGKDSHGDKQSATRFQQARGEAKHCCTESRRPRHVHSQQRS